MLRHARLTRSKVGKSSQSASPYMKASAKPRSDMSASRIQNIESKMRISAWPSPGHTEFDSGGNVYRLSDVMISIRPTETLFKTLPMWSSSAA